MENLLLDIRYALRGLKRTPGFTVMATLTIALGLGATAAIFSVVNGVLLRPLAYEDPSELVRVWGRFLPESGFDFPYFSLDPTEFLDLQENNGSFEAVSAYTFAGVTMTAGGDAAERRLGLITSANLFELLGVEAEIGRVFLPEEDVEGGPDVVMLSHALWETRFGSNPEILGTSISVNRTSFEVVGVLPAGFAFPSPGVELYSLLHLPPNPSNRKSHYLSVVARVAEGMSLRSAGADLDRLMANWEKEYPDIHTGHFLFLEGFQEAMVSGVRPALLLLSGAVGFLLLIVCANVANLLLVRGHARSGAAAVRLALGATRWRVVQLSLVESGLLVVAGGALGLTLARFGVKALLALQAGSLPLANRVEVDATAFGFTAGLALLTALVFGLAPALHTVRKGSSSTLHEEGRGGTATRRKQAARNALIATEVALSFVLVIGAGLMTRSLMKLLDEDPGFEVAGALVANFSLPSTAYPDLGDGVAFLNEVVEATEALPGVTAVTHVTHLPMRGGQSVNDFALEGIPEPGPGQPTWNAGVAAVRSNYFETMGIAILEGRGFDPSLDRVDGVPAAIVSRRLADQFFVGSDPIGQRMRLSGGTDAQPWWTIVGVVDDVQYTQLGNEGSPMYYVLTDQIPLYNTLTGFERFGTLVVRSRAENPLEMANPLRRIVAEIDSEIPLTNVGTLDDVVRSSVAQTRFVMVLMGLFAGLALVLGAIGIYGVTSFVVLQRRREIGIRKALGAAGGEVASLVVRQGMRPVVVGIVFGLGGALVTGGLLSGLLYEVNPIDVVTYAVVAGVLAAVAFTALLVPARRAAGVDPTISLRAD